MSIHSLAVFCGSQTGGNPLYAAHAAELRAEFVAHALEARAEMLKSGKGYDAEEVHAYLRARVSGKPAKRPKAKSWRS